MKLTIFTRCYIKEVTPDCLISDMSPMTIYGMNRLLTSSKNISWVILVSNLNGSLLPIRNFSNLSVRTRVINVNKKLSCWDARVELMKDIRLFDCMDKDSYYMQLDADDEVINRDELASFVDQMNPEEDLISFGRYITRSDHKQATQELSHEWVRVLKFKKYIASESRSYFNFLFNYRILDLIVTEGLLNDKPHLLDDPTQATDDTCLAIELSRFEFTVGCLALDTVLYILHDSNISHHKNIEFNNKLSKLISKLNCYEINGNYYSIINKNSIHISWTDKMNPYENVISEGTPMAVIGDLFLRYPLIMEFSEKPSYCEFLTYAPYGVIRLKNKKEIKFEDYYET